MSSTNKSGAADERLDAVIAEYLEAVERGDSPTPDVWLERYPEFASELAQFFADESQFDQIVSPLRTTAVGSVTPTPCNTALAPVEAPLRTVKDYDLLAEIGRGGMGIIYRARQRSLNRLVAVKMIRSAEWATPAERMRFRWEAEAVAALDHPNIVPIYEVGELTADDGTSLPFFSMKLIEGEDLCRGRDQLHLDHRSVARLIGSVARAIDHAHQRGILHRDLKPANILLSQDDGRVTPHVTDFGLAARLQQPRGQTVAGAIVGTPTYLAPEVASGRPATIASDVYALGAILYELLTGEPPFHAGTPLETIRLLTTTTARPPRNLDAAIPVDLETICLKCLNPEPGRRYVSAAELADDLERYLAGRPIAARPIGALATFTRFCRRQPAIAGLGGALALAIMVGLPLIVWNWRRAVEHERLAEERLEEARRERERADDGFALAHGAFDDLFRLIGDPNTEELSESDAINRELLDRGLRYYQDFVDRRRDDPAMRRELASAMCRIASITQRLKTHRESLAVLDQTIEFLRDQLKQYPDDVTLVERLSRALVNRGKSQMQLDQIDDSLHSHEEAVAVWSRAPSGADPAVVARGRGYAILDRGLAIQRAGDWAGALESYRAAKSMLLSCSDPARVQSPLVLCCLNLAAAENHYNRLDAALKEAGEGEQIAERLYRQSPNSEETQMLMGQSRHKVGTLQVNAGRNVEARLALADAQRFFDGLHRAKPRATQYKRLLALVYDDIASLERKEKHPGEALTAQKKSVQLLRELVQLDGESRIDRHFLAQASFNLGHIQRESKHYDLAAPAYEEARTQRLFLLARRPDNEAVRIELARTCFYLGACLGNIRRSSEALAADEEAIQQFRIVMDRKGSQFAYRKTLGSCLGNKAIVLRDMGRPADALAATSERVSLYQGNAEELYDAAMDFARTYNWLDSKGDRDVLQARTLSLAVDALRQALAAGIPNLDPVRTEPVFARMLKTEAFQALFIHKNE